MNQLSFILTVALVSCFPFINAADPVPFLTVYNENADDPTKIGPLKAAIVFPNNTIEDIGIICYCNESGPAALDEKNNILYYALDTMIYSINIVTKAEGIPIQVESNSIDGPEQIYDLVFNQASGTLFALLQTIDVVEKNLSLWQLAAINGSNQHVNLTVVYTYFNLFEDYNVTPSWQGSTFDPSNEVYYSQWAINDNPSHQIATAVPLNNFANYTFQIGPCQNGTTFAPAWGLKFDNTINMLIGLIDVIGDAPQRIVRIDAKSGECEVSDTFGNVVPVSSMVNDDLMYLNLFSYGKGSDFQVLNTDTLEVVLNITTDTDIFTYVMIPLPQN